MNLPNTISLEQVKQAAKEFLQKYHQGLSLPVPIEDIVELKLKIKIILIQGLIKNFGINALINQKFDSIVIDENMFQRQPERIRFTLAEEIGHLFLHKDWYIKNGPKAMEDYLSWHLKLDRKTFGFIERQAKTFAGMVLIPETVLKKEWQEFIKKFNLPEQCSIYDLPDTLPELAHKFFVSGECLLVRLSFLKLVNIPDGFWKRK